MSEPMGPTATTKTVESTSTSAYKKIRTSYNSTNLTWRNTNGGFVNNCEFSLNTDPQTMTLSFSENQSATQRVDSVSAVTRDANRVVGVWTLTQQAASPTPPSPRNPKINGVTLDVVPDGDDPLTFVIETDGVIDWRATGDITEPKPIEYQKNSDNNWQPVTSAGIPVYAGDEIQFKGNNGQYAESNAAYHHFFTTCKFKVRGNIMSLIKADDFANLTTLTSAYTFYRLFSGCSGLTDASQLQLPAQTLTWRCYELMFSDCDNLTVAPKVLPAKTLAGYCYCDMFSYCGWLTGAPQIQAEIMAEHCCEEMFRECERLLEAPSLPATTLANYCYCKMFLTCKRLITPPQELPATTLAEGCYQSMFAECFALTTAPKLSGEILANSCYLGMFRRCTLLESAPELPVTDLRPSCYSSMFSYCHSLSGSPELPAEILVEKCYQDMFFHATNLKYIKCLATNISANSCTAGWVDTVASAGTFVKASIADWSSKTGNDGVPANWTVQDAS